MGLKELSLSGALAVMFSVAPAFSDTISGSGGAGFQSWTTNNLNQSGSPYWDNSSMDGSNRNVGFYLVNAPTAPLPGAPGALPYWGNTFTSNTDSGGTADLSFFFQKDSSSSTAILKLEVAAFSNVNQFGWYDITETTPTLHTLFSGPDAAPTTNNFSPSPQYGFYIQTMGGATYYTQSALNSGGDTNHQHFAVFRESSATGAESYWIGVEDLSVSGFGGNEGNTGDYQDMLIHISVLPTPGIPEPSTAMLVLSGSLLIFSAARGRSARRGGQRLPRRREAGLTDEAST
jgi:hypothetical protein